MMSLQAILNGNRKITVDTSLRLAKFIGISDRYFLDMQNDLDIHALETFIKEEIASINTFQATSI